MRSSTWFLLMCLVVLSGRAESITVEPPDSLTNYWGSEWSSPGDFSGWTLSQVTNAVADGFSLSGTASGTDAQVILSPTNGPDLDLGFNDYLELRLQLDAAYTGDIQLYFGVTNAGMASQSGFSATRMVTIPSSLIPKDGAFHTYRVPMGLVPMWRGYLRDLRIDPVSGTGSPGRSFSIDYVRIGDVPGAAYFPRYSSACPAPGNTNQNGQVVSDMESKRFRILWDPVVATNSNWKTNMARGSLRNLEECWQVYVNQLGYNEPAEAWTAAQRDGKKYKVNLTTYYGGYWAGGDGQFGWLNITPDGLRVDPPTWVIPHEGMHVFQMHQGGGFTDNPPMGPWWEGHANYGRERWLYAMNRYFEPNSAYWSAPGAAFVRTAQLFHGHGVHYYDHWPLWLYLDENPDDLTELRPGANGMAFSARVWRESTTGEYIYTTINRLAPSAGVKNIFGYAARRNATWDYSQQTYLKASLNGQDPELIRRLQFSELRAVPDAPGWWTVPPECAPMQYAYATHEFVPQGTGAGRVVTVNFQGIPNPARQADWRASLVVVNGSGTARYSSLWNSGSNAVTLAADENQVYLVVAATPGQVVPSLQLDKDQPYISHPARVRFPYELQVFGATPKETTNTNAGLVQHPNGGGWRSTNSTVDATAYIGPNARVLGTAQVRGNARVEDYAVVQDQAQVRDSAIVSGHALLRGSARAQQWSRVRDYATLSESALVTGYSRVGGHASLSGSATITNNATVKGAGYVWRSDASDFMGGDAVLDGDCVVGQKATNGFHFGWEWGGLSDATIASKTAPPGVFASYAFGAMHPYAAKDEYGATDGWLRGNPTWKNYDGRLGVLALDGTNDWLLLDRWVSDFQDTSISAWLKWDGGAANQPLFWFGSGSNRCYTFTPDDGTGRARFTIRSNAVEQTIQSPVGAIPGVWMHWTVVLAGNSGRIYVNGGLAASGTITLDPEDVLSANGNTDQQWNWVGRGGDDAGPRLRGTIDEVRIHSRALTDSEVAATANPPDTAGTLYVDLRASDSSAGTATWTNRAQLGHFTRVGTPFKTNNLAGLPGVTFKGSGDAYQGPNTLPDLETNSDRSIEVWAYNPALADEETMVSWAHRGFDGRNMGFNFGSNPTWGAATHWGAQDVGWGVNPTANAWHHLVYTFDGGTVRMYVDGAFRNSDTAPTLNTFTNEPINLACQRDTANGSRSFWFTGTLNTVRIYGGVLSAEKIATLYAAGASGAASGSTNQPPVAVLISPTNGVSLPAGVPVAVTANAGDPDGLISRVEFFAGPIFLGADSNALYQASTAALTPGSYALRAVAVDSVGGRGTSAPVQITIVGTNAAPVVNLTNRTWVAGSAFSLGDYASDPDVPAQGMVYELLTAPAGATIHPTNGMITWTPPVSAAGTSNFFRVRVTENGWYWSLPPEADTYVQAGTNNGLWYAISNYGTAPNLTVKNTGPTAWSTRESYLRFNLEGVPGLVREATLQLTLKNALVPGVQGLAFVPEDNWGELTTRWTNKPAAEAPFTTWLLDTNGLPKGYGIPITEAVAGELYGDGKLSLQIAATNQTSNGYIDYGSREDPATANRPALALICTNWSTLSTTQSFWVRLAGAPLVSAPRLTNATFGFTVGATEPGVRYVTMASSNLTSWVAVATNQTTQSSFDWTEPVANAPQRFYRVQVIP